MRLMSGIGLLDSDFFVPPLWALCLHLNPQISPITQFSSKAIS